MKKLLAAACVLVPMLLRAANPIITEQFSADPAPMVDGDTVYLYVGQDEAEENKNGYRMFRWLVYSSTDMVNWTFHGSPLKPTDFSWSRGDAYAAHTVKKDGKYYWFVSTSVKPRAMGIGVAVSDSPTGPFTDAIGEPLITADMTPDHGNHGWEDIDPAVFIDDDGTSYLFWGNRTCYYARLKPCLTELDGPIQTVDVPTFEEAPWVHKRGNLYYLTYASDFPEKIAYATATSIEGPWTAHGLLTEGAGNSNTIHPGIIHFKGKDYFFYHTGMMPRPMVGGSFRRAVCIEELTYNADGTMKKVVQTSEGVAAVETKTKPAFSLPDLPETVQLFTSFRGSGDGLHMAWSTDSKHWKELKSVYIKPTVGSGLMRDPHILRAPNGVFHLVWTTGWKDKGIGYANSKDLVHWSLQKNIPVMEVVEGTQNCWAPEIFYDDTRDEFMITWSSDVDGRFPDTKSKDRMNNRTYYVTTKDFKTFSEPQLLVDPGFDHIDMTILKVADGYRAVIKEGDKQKRGIPGPIHTMRADDPRGPWTLTPPPAVTERAEGPALIQSGGETLLYVDFYSDGRYGAYKTEDWRYWSNVSDQVDVVDGQRHGTVLEVPGDLVEDLLLRDSDWAGIAPATVLDEYTADPSIRVFGDTYYIYPTIEQPNWMTTEFKVWSSKNLVDWTNEGAILDLPKDVSWANVRAWAPDCIGRNGKYYFYFCADGKIGVAVAPTPTGPFKDALDKPLLNRKADPRIHTNTIDPWAFIDDDDQAYLYWGNGKPCQVFKLNEDMISLDGDPVDIHLRDFREGICVFKRNGKYYFMWSIDDARSPNYRVGWGTSDSPLGPVETPKDRADFIVLEKNAPAIGTAHHSVVNVPGTDRWYVAYHRHGLPGGGGYKRQTCLVRMEFDDAGNILPMDPLTIPFQPGDVGEPIVDGKGL